MKNKRHIVGFLIVLLSLVHVNIYKIEAIATETTKTEPALNVIVPLTIDIKFNANGTNTVSNYKIENNGTQSVAISKMEFKKNSDWSIVNDNVDFTKEKANTKSLSISMKDKANKPYVFANGSATPNLKIPSKSFDTLSFAIKRTVFTNSSSTKNIFTLETTISEIPNDERDFTFDKNTGTIIKYIGMPKNVIIPKTIDGVTVKKIEDFAFQGKGLISVTIPDTIVSIGTDAFSFNQLMHVTIPNSVTSIGNSAFSSNKLLTVVMPNNITTIGNAAFASNQLTTVTIPNGVTSIGINAFSSNQLTTVIIPNSVGIIRKSAFSSNQLTTVTIPNGVAQIDESAFSDNQLSAITLPSNITHIGRFAFAFNTLTSVTFSGTTPPEFNEDWLSFNRQLDGTTPPIDIIVPVGSLSSYYTALTYCLPLDDAYSKAQISEVVSEHDFTFDINTGTITDYLGDLSVLRIPTTINNITVKRIGDSAFSERDLTSVIIPSSVISIGDYAFAYNYLDSVIFNGQTPPVFNGPDWLSKNKHEGDFDKATIRILVPYNSLSAYTTALLNKLPTENRYNDAIIYPN